MSKDNKVFIVYMISLAVDIMIFIYLFWITQIILLITNEALMIVFIEYSNLANIFLFESIAKLSEYTKITDHFIKLIDK